MKNRIFRSLMGGLALVSLGTCLAAPLLFFLGRISEGTYKTLFLLASVAWFVLATARTAARRSPRAS
jgi:hypothetical protein